MSASYFDKNSKTSKLVILISDGEDHSEGVESVVDEAEKNGLKIITIGVGTEKGGTIPLKRNGKVEGYQRDRNDEVVVTKLNEETLKAIAKGTKGDYINGSNTKQVLEYVKNALDNIEKTEFETKQFANYQSQFQWFIGAALFFFVFGYFLDGEKDKMGKKTELV